MFTKVCAIELAGKGILVNCLAPGVIDEGMGDEILRSIGAALESSRQEKIALKDLASGRLATEVFKSYGFF